MQLTSYKTALPLSRSGYVSFHIMSELIGNTVPTSTDVPKNPSIYFLLYNDAADGDIVSFGGGIKL